MIAVRLSTIGLLAASLLTASVGCGTNDVDPLDPELLRKLARGRGSASGSARSGVFQLERSTQSCDCPSLEIEEQILDLCTLALLSGFEVTLLEGSGMLVIGAGAQSTFITMLSGPIESDGSFVVAEIQNLTSVGGPLEVLRRLEGRFLNDDTAEGWAGQRLLGELADKNVDCRWIGSFVLTRT